MRYGIIPTRLTEWLALRLGQVPSPVLDTLIAPLQARALMSAQQLGVLARLSRPATTAELAQELRLDEACLSLLLRVLVAMGYVRTERGRHRLTRLGLRCFGTDARTPCIAFVEHAASQWSMIERLDEVLKAGRGIDFHEHQTPSDWDAYQRAMLENARGFADFVAAELPVPRGATRCLDVAGSHGYVGARLCRKHRGLRSTVIDRKEALPHARALAREHGYDDVVRFEEGDISRLSLDDAVDVALLCNILHHFSEAENVANLTALRRGMTPGATLGIFEIEAPSADDKADAAGDGLALYFRISSTSTCFRGRDYERWLRAAGFAQVRTRRSVRLPSRVLIIATNP